MSWPSGSGVEEVFFKGFWRNDLSHCRIRGSSGDSRMSVAGFWRTSSWLL